MSEQNYPAWKRQSEGADGFTSFHCIKCGGTLMAVPHESPPFDAKLTCRRCSGKPIDYEFRWNGPTVDPEVTVVSPSRSGEGDTTDDILDRLDETARQIVIGARAERDRALSQCDSAVNANRLLARGLETERQHKIQANGRVAKLEEEVKALKASSARILGGPDRERAQQIDEHLERLQIAAEGLSDATMGYRTAFAQLTEMYAGLPGWSAADPDNYDHAFDYRWRHDDDPPTLAPAEPKRGGAMKDAVDAQ